MLRIIEDPLTQQKWIIREEGITKADFHGAALWLNLFDVDKPYNRFITRQYLIERLIKQNKSFLRCSSDVVRNLTLDEYLALGKLFKTLQIRYDKKKNQFLC